MAARISSLVCGRSESAMGYALLVNGKYRAAELSFHRAAALLHSHPAEEADNIRRIGRLRIAQKSPAEARRLFEAAIDLCRRKGSEDQIGKNYVALGYLELDLGRYREAAGLLTEALEHLAQQGDGYLIAVHNLMVALVMIRDYEAISDLVKKIHSIRKEALRAHGAKLRLDWLVALGLIPLGAHRVAIKSLNRIVDRLKDANCQADEIATAFVDLSQAYFASGDRAKACKNLKDARQYFLEVPEISTNFIAKIDAAIVQLETEDGETSPSDLRARYLNAATALIDTTSTTNPAAGGPLTSRSSLEPQVSSQRLRPPEVRAAAGTGRHRWRSGSW